MFPGGFERYRRYYYFNEQQQDIELLKREVLSVIELQLGAYSFFGKPYELEILVGKVRDTLGTA